MDFFKQIQEDIEIIKEDFGHLNQHLLKSDYAFNHWVLSRLYSIDDDIIIDNITEYSDDGVDCFVFFEDEKQLYIIQNKFYTDTELSFKYVQKEFLNHSLDTLDKNKYFRSSDLQAIYNKYRDDKEFKIGLRVYVSNNKSNDDIKRLVRNYNGLKDAVYYCDAEIYYLDDINNKYFHGRIKEKKTRYYTLRTINKNTIMDLKETYEFVNDVSAKYVFTPVSEIYRILEKASKNNHSLFSENIREYLGNKGVNTNITNTLESEEDNKNFFFYNNGITIICDEIKSQALRGVSGKEYEIQMKNPQIVNGCQTCNSIYNVLRKFREDQLDEKFQDTFVMTKVLTIKGDNQSVLRESIVRYNNSQNKIDEKHFEANREIYNSIKKEFLERGLLLATKQSDTYQYKNSYKINFRQFTSKLDDKANIFDMKFEKITDIIVPLEKLLQILVSVYIGPTEAFQKKSHVLKVGTDINDKLQKILTSQVNINDLVNLYIMYLKAFKENSKNKSENSPIPYYLLGFLGKVLNVNQGSMSYVYQEVFKSNENFTKIYNYFKQLSDLYKQQMFDNGYEYNKMIKRPIEESIFKQMLSMTKVTSKVEFEYVNKLIEKKEN